MTRPQSLTLKELPERRKNTELVCQLLQQELISYLNTLRPLVMPERVLAKYPGAKLEVGVIEKAYGQFLDNFKKLAGASFGLSREFNPDWVTDINGRLELYRWEYLHEIETPDGPNRITMTSPRRWVLTYPCGYNFSQMREAVKGSADQRPDQMRQFVINSLVIQTAIARAPGLTHLLAALRYELVCEQVPELNGLPLVIITSSIPSFRPPDDLIQAATEFSGVPAFIELIDTDAIESWEDPLKIRIQESLTAPQSR